MAFPNYLIWSILGLESLYADGTQSILNQLKKKSSILLNLDEQENKLINTIYDYRSRFLHGQINLYNPHLLGALDEKAVKFSHKETDHQCNIFLLFLISLQYCAEHDIHDLKFEYKLI